MSLLVLTVALLGIVWQLGYSHTVFVPSPATVWSDFKELLSTSSTYDDIRASVTRLVLGMAIGTMLGFAAGVAGTYSRRMARVVQTYVHIAFSIPSLMAAFIALVVFGISDVGVLAAVAVIVFPFVTSPVLDGVKALDKSLSEMARIYNFSRIQHLRHIVVPNIAPYLLSGMRNAHALGWKVLIVAEIFSVRSGIGYEFHQAYDDFVFSRILAWLVFMLAVIGVIEFAVLRPLEDWTLRWRSTTPAKAPALARAISRLLRRRERIAV
ncbi:MAG: ABC transporter permease [Candidatus Acidiferrales bacterium]